MDGNDEKHVVLDISSQAKQSNSSGPNSSNGLIRAFHHCQRNLTEVVPDASYVRFEK